MFGGYGIVMQVDAIYEKNLWKFIKALCGIGSEKELQRREAEAIKQFEIERAQREKKLEEDREKRNNQVQEILAPLRAEVEAHYKPIMYKDPGRYLQVVLKQDNTAAIKLYTTWKGSFGRTFYYVDYFESVAALKVELRNPAPEKMKGGSVLKRDLSQLKLYDPNVSNGNAPRPSAKAKARAETKSDLKIGVTHDREWTWAKFTEKPNPEIIKALHRLGGTFSGPRVAWYFKQHIEASVFADAGIEF